MNKILSILLTISILTSCSNKEVENNLIASTCNSNDQFIIEDLGITLTSKQVTGEKLNPVADPSVIITKDGKVRLYFLAGGLLGIMSAISDDGINFEIEESILQAKDTSFKVLGAPRVIRDENDNIKLFVKAGEESDNGIASFISYDDGLSFQKESIIITNDELGLIKASKFTVIKITENNYQAYVADGASSDPEYLDKRKIKTLYSTDLNEWELYDKALVGYGAEYITETSREPFPLKRSGNCITLFYVHAGHGIYYSTVEDGITFEIEYDLGLEDLQAAGPWILYIPEENKYLIYYDATNEENGHHIKVAELQLNYK